MKKFLAFLLVIAIATSARWAFSSCANPTQERCYDVFACNDAQVPVGCINDIADGDVVSISKGEIFDVLDCKEQVNPENSWFTCDRDPTIPQDCCTVFIYEGPGCRLENYALTSVRTISEPCDGSNPCD